MNGVGAVILAGGGSRRMGGENKAFLKLGNDTFLDLIATQLDNFDELLLSVDDPVRYSGCDFRMVQDVFPGKGAIGGLYSALKACESDRILAVSCDIPLFSRGLSEYMLSYLYGEFDAFVVSDRGGRLHPLCACYRKSAADVFEKQISLGNLRMTDALDRLNVRRIPLEHSIYPDETVCNINSPSDYAILRRRTYGPPVIAVSGIKNSGKTTLLENILPLLCANGIKTAVIKHDGHDFVPDVPGTDSYRLRRAGAKSVAVYSGSRYMLTGERAGLTAEELAGRFRDADLILLEGGKHTVHPKIEVVRRENASGSVCDPSTLLAICTDDDTHIEYVRAVGLNDYEEICRVILRYLEGGGDPCSTASEEK